MLDGSSKSRCEIFMIALAKFVTLIDRVSQCAQTGFHGSVVIIQSGRWCGRSLLLPVPFLKPSLHSAAYGAKRTTPQRFFGRTAKSWARTLCWRIARIVTGLLNRPVMAIVLVLLLRALPCDRIDQIIKMLQL